LPDGLRPTSSGTRKAIEKTEPISPTDYAIVSSSVSFRSPPSDVFTDLLSVIVPRFDSDPPGWLQPLRSRTGSNDLSQVIS
jgi:hypothetical protein